MKGSKHDLQAMGEAEATIVEENDFPSLGFAAFSRNASIVPDDGFAA